MKLHIRRLNIKDASWDEFATEHAIEIECNGQRFNLVDRYGKLCIHMPDANALAVMPNASNSVTLWKAEHD
jgi:hypothetical protein